MSLLPKSTSIPLSEGNPTHCLHCGQAFSKRRLNEDQRRVFDLIVLGFSNKQIAAELGLTVKRVKDVLWLLYRKANVNSRSQLIVGYYTQRLRLALD